MWFGTVKEYYEDGLYSKDDVKIFVEAEMISKEEFEDITGENYLN